MKTCNSCKLKKGSGEFYKRSKSSDGLQSRCKSCTKEYAIRLKTRTHVVVNSKICTRCRLEKAADEYVKNKYTPDGLTVACKKCRNLEVKAYQKQNPEKTLLSACKTRAKKGGLPFNLEVKDIIIPEKCPMLGIKLESGRGKSGLFDSSPTVDRIIPEKGYTKGNVQVISGRANRIKTNATADELMAVAKYCKEQQDGSI